MTVLPSTLMERVANSTPIVDFESKLNSFRVNRESTVGVRQHGPSLPRSMHTVSVERQRGSEGAIYSVDCVEGDVRFAYTRVTN